MDQSYIDIEHLHKPTPAWGPLQIYNFYRFGLSLSLLILLTFNRTFLGGYLPTLFLYTTLAYFVFSVLCLIGAYTRKPAYGVQAILAIFIDIISIIFIMHSSGGLDTGLGMLLIITVAASSILTPGLLSFLYTSMATIAVLLEQAISAYFNIFPHTAYTAAGIMGMVFFATALTTNAAEKKLKLTEQLSNKQKAELYKLEKLNAMIIQHMQTGVIVTDRYFHIRLINSAADKLLGEGKTHLGIHIKSANQELYDVMLLWKNNPNIENELFPISPHSIQAQAHFVHLEETDSNSTLIFIEDISQQVKEAQRLKLAAIGRLTASIAHEIRNPLGAISHAAQLLGESTSLEKSDTRLINIINDNTARTNKIIENILMLSKDKAPKPERIHLSSWLNDFIEQYVHPGNDSPKIDLFVSPEDTYIHIDPNQLYQVLSNLCLNGIRYSLKHSNKAEIKLSAGQDANTLIKYIDVIDYGPGIDDEQLKYLFEPFFTTEQTGTGLGLFIARELCQSNGAKLEYYRIPEGGSQFRITFELERRKKDD